MIIHDFGSSLSVINNYTAELRDKDIQKDSHRFRLNLERIGQILCYEMSKTLNYTKKEVSTPLGVKEIMVASDEIVICSILRAGLSMHWGLLKYLDHAASSFISAYRKHLGNNKFEIAVDYMASPSIEGKVLCLADPMLATGYSLANVYKSILKLGTPKSIHLMAIIGAKQGIEYIKDIMPADTHLWIATIDDALNENGYIVPGLGDAGDLAFGKRLE